MVFKAFWTLINGILKKAELLWTLSEIVVWLESLVAELAISACLTGQFTSYVKIKKKENMPEKDIIRYM